MNYCASCDVEFKVRHEADHAFFPVQFCPFCGEELDIEDQYEPEEDEE